MLTTTDTLPAATALRVATTTSALAVLHGSLSALGPRQSEGDSPMLTFCYCTGTAVPAAGEQLDLGRAA